MGIGVNASKDNAADPHLTIDPSAQSAEREQLEFVVQNALADIETTRPGFGEYLRLKELDSHYRGTQRGALYLSNLHKRSFLQDGEDETPLRKADIEIYRPIYDEIASGLTEFDRLTGLETAAAATRKSESPNLYPGAIRPTMSSVPKNPYSFPASDPFGRLNAIRSSTQNSKDSAAMVMHAIAKNRGHVTRSQFVESLRKALEETNRAGESFPEDKAPQDTVLAERGGATEIKQ